MLVVESAHASKESYTITGTTDYAVLALVRTTSQAQKCSFVLVIIVLPGLPLNCSYAGSCYNGIGSCSALGGALHIIRT